MRNIFIKNAFYASYEYIISVPPNQVSGFIGIINSKHSFSLTRVYGNINARVDGGTHFFVPLWDQFYELSIKTPDIFDEEHGNTNYMYNWSCIILDTSQYCNNIELPNINNNEIEIDISNITQYTYLFTLNIIDSNNPTRNDETQFFITKTSHVNMTISTKYTWNNMKYLPTFHDDIILQINIDSISGSISNTPINGEYNYKYICEFEPKLNDESIFEIETKNISVSFRISSMNTIPNTNYIASCNVINIDTKQYGKNELIINIGNIPIINAFNIYLDYDLINNDKSTNIYKNMVSNISNHLINNITFGLFNLGSNCIDNPCIYSYFMEYNNLPFLITLGYGLSVSILPKVLLPFNNTNIILYACIENRIGARICQKETIDIVNSINICNNWENILEFIQLIILQDDKILLAQLLTNLLLYNTDNSICKEIIANKVLNITSSQLMDEYFIHVCGYVFVFKSIDIICICT